MAKKPSRSSPNQSKVKKPSEVASPAKKPSEVTTTSKKPLVVSPPAKKPVEEIASTSKTKKQPVINTPPESLTEDEEMESEEEGESSSEEEDKLKKPVKAPSASAPVVNAPAIQSSGSESESETEGGETNSETEPPAPPPAPASAPVASSRALRKRPSEVTAATEVNASKRGKTVTEESENTAKKSLFQRSVWSEDEEIALLQEMLLLKTETGKIPSDDFAASFEMVKGSKYLEGKSCSQFSSKVNCLKIKYMNKKMIRTDPHDLKCLDFCKKIWGNHFVVVKSKRKMKVEDDESDGVSDWFERANLVGELAGFGVVDDVAIKKKWSLVSVETKKKLKKKWEDLKSLDFERWVKKNEFVFEVSSAIYNAN
ncbi:putative transcription factor [Cardamine amara subsp. amara]|uniref:Transcription factor n=1 Tax=Cardamine amara subsp. amara TaxID=228776 RepID=A0ABD1B6Z1_CARAN